MRMRGFSLVELLVGIGIFITITTIIVSILFTVLRVSNKTETLTNLKQNGDTALSQLIHDIRYAKRLSAPAVCAPPVTRSQITITNFDNGVTTLSCSGTTIASNGASLVDTTSVAMSGCSFTCSQTTLSDPPTVTIRFTLSDKNAGSFVETTGSVPFETSVTMRNFSR